MPLAAKAEATWSLLSRLVWSGLVMTKEYASNRKVVAPDMDQ